MTSSLPLDDIQGNVLHGYRFRCAGHLLVRLPDDESSARRLLERLIPAVTPGTRRPGLEALNVSFTHAGLARLGVHHEILEAFPTAFRKGPADRAALLGDVGPSAPSEWDPPWRSGRTDVVLTVHGTPERYPASRDRWWGVVSDAGGEVLFVQETRALDNMVEHFGYADGAAQPALEGVPGTAASVRGGGIRLDGSRWRPLKLGEFILGHPDEDGVTVDWPDAALVLNGTYAVHRKLKQDVWAFDQALEKAADLTGLTKETVAAKVMGRWRDGMPIEIAPRRRARDLTGEAVDRPPNDFHYLPQDEDGFVCPWGAHIRRTNPRDSLPVAEGARDPARFTARHRIIRRGMPYGDPLPRDAVEDDEGDRGLYFVCYNADIERQFELVQRAWCLDGDAFFLGEDQDFLLANQRSTRKMTIPMRDDVPKFIDSPPDLVVTKGAAYLFVPGISALRRLAAGDFSIPPR